MKQVIFMLLFCGFLASCNKGQQYLRDLGDGYYIEYGNNEGYDLMYPDSMKHILSNVVNSLSNDIFVTVRTEECQMNNLENDYKQDSTNKVSKKKPMEIYKDYYIIYKKSGETMGPFQKPEYLEKMKELNIPDSLRVDK